MSDEPLMPLVDQTFSMVQSICDRISHGKLSYEEIQEVKAQQVEMYPLILQMEEKLLKDLNSLDPSKVDTFGKYTFAMNKFALRKAIQDLESRIAFLENYSLAIKELEGGEMHYVTFSPDGKPTLETAPGECLEELEKALNVRRAYSLNDE